MSGGFGPMVRSWTQTLIPGHSGTSHNWLMAVLMSITMKGNVRLLFLHIIQNLYIYSAHCFIFCCVLNIFQAPFFNPFLTAGNIKNIFCDNEDVNSD